MKSIFNKSILLAGFLLMKASVIYAQFLNEDELKFIKEYVYNIDIDTAYRNGDWTPVIDQVRDKKIILIGEFTHGAREVFLARNALIKALHQELGIDVLLFETNMGDLILSKDTKMELSDYDLTRRLYGVWRSTEFADLMTYVKNNDLEIAGFDVQEASSVFANLVKEEASKVGVNQNRFIELEFRKQKLIDKMFSNNEIYDSIHNPTLTLIDDYKMVDSILHVNEDPDNQIFNLLIRRSIANRIAHLTYMMKYAKNKPTTKQRIAGGPSWVNLNRTRDSLMAENVGWLIDRFYPNKKVIIIAHNAHISKNEGSMGGFLMRKYGSEMYSIGAFAGKGSYLYNNRKEEVMLPVDSTHLDLKHVIQASVNRANFVHVPEHSIIGSQWLFKEITINDTQLYRDDISNKIILSEYYDGLILLDQVSPSERFY